MTVSLPRLDRRHFMRVGAVSVGYSLSGWLGRLAAAADGQPAIPYLLVFQTKK